MPDVAGQGSTEAEAELQELKGKRARKIPVRAAEINIMFSEAFDAAPPLPRPLKSKHAIRFINGAGLLIESISVAPLNEKEEAFLREKKLDKVVGLARCGVRCCLRLKRHHR